MFLVSHLREGIKTNSKHSSSYLIPDGKTYLYIQHVLRCLSIHKLPERAFIRLSAVSNPGEKLLLRKRLLLFRK